MGKIFKVWGKCRWVALIRDRDYDKVDMCKTWEKCDFSKKNWQNGNAIVVQVENLKNFISRMTKQTSLLESSHEI